MNGQRHPSDSRPIYGASSFTAGRGSPSLKENAPLKTLNYINSLRVKNTKTGGSPTSDHSQKRFKGSPDLNTGPLKAIQNKYLQTGSGSNSDPHHAEKHPTPSSLLLHVGMAQQQRRISSKKLSFSPSPSSNHRGDRDSSLNKSNTEHAGSPKQGSPPTKTSPGGAAQRGSPKMGSQTSTSIAYSSGGPALVYPGSPSTNQQSDEYLLDAHKHPITFYNLDNTRITYKCINHPERRSKFYVVETAKLKRIAQSLSFMRGLCSSCAVNLAKRGFQTMEIPDEEEEEKTNLLRSYLARVEKEKEDHEDNLAFVARKMEKIDSVYQEEKEYLGEFERIVEQIVEGLQRNMAQMREEVDNRYRTDMQASENLKNAIRDSLDHSELAYQDVSRNFERAVLDFKLEKIVTELQKFEKNLAKKKNNYIGVFNQQKRTIVMKVRKVDFQTIIDIGKELMSIFVLSEEQLPEDDDSDHKNRKENLDMQSDDEEDLHNLDLSKVGKRTDHNLSQEHNRSNMTHINVSFDNKEIFESALGQELGHTQSKSNAHINNSGMETGYESSSKSGVKNSNHPYIHILDKISRTHAQNDDYYSNLVAHKDRYNRFDLASLCLS